MQGLNESVEPYFERLYAANYGIDTCMATTLMLAFAENLKDEYTSRKIQEKINKGSLKTLWDAMQGATKIMEQTSWKDLSNAPDEKSSHFEGG